MWNKSETRVPTNGGSKGNYPGGRGQNSEAKSPQFPKAFQKGKAACPSYAY